MARKLTCLAGAVAVLVLVHFAPAEAQQPTSATYDVRFEEVTNNCPDSGMHLDQGTVKLVKKRGKKVSVEITGAPVMKGTRGKAGKFKAEGSGPAAIAGTKGKFSIAGRANRAKIQLSFIAEFYRDKKPLCTQSWAASGKRRQ